MREGIIPVIPLKANRKQPRDHDKYIYKERGLIECVIGKLKQFRKVFSRFDKVDQELHEFRAVCRHFDMATLKCRQNLK